MGRGGDQEVASQRRDLGNLEKNLQEGMKKDMPAYVQSTDYRQGFAVSFLHEARKVGNYETPRLGQGALKRPAILLSFQVDRDLFLQDPTLDEDFDGEDERLALFVSNRLLPLAQAASGGRVIYGPALEDVDGLDEDVPLQILQIKDKEITYSLALS